MIRPIVVFIFTFVAGAVVALAARAALYEPHSKTTAPAAEEHAAMVDNASKSTKPMASQHEEHTAGKAASEAGATKPAKSAKAESERKTGGKDASETSAKTPVNTLCAICGMEVDPTVPTMEYQGKTIGFGCRMCPPKFKANPDKYGPAYLRNEVIEK